MRNRNISFAEVLKNRAKSPRIEAQGNLSLSEMIQQFQKYPQTDYTLRLGNKRTVQKNNQSNKMLFSRTTIQSQADIFDSWIQRQSMVGNKENIINQPQGKIKTQLANLPQESLKYNLGFQAKGPAKMPTQMMAGLKHRNGRNKQFQSQFEPHIFENIQNYSKGQNSKKMFSSNSSMNLSQKSKELCFLDEKGDKKLQLTKLNIQKMCKNSKQRDNLRNQFNKITENKIQQITNLFTKEEMNFVSNQHLHKLINSTQNIHTEIATLAKKYLDQKNQRSVDEQQEFLLEDSRAQDRKIDWCADKNYCEQLQNNDEIQRKRWQDAKCMVNGFFDKFNKPKSTNKIMSEQQRCEKQIINQPIPSKDCGQNGGSHLFVGYSFALNQVIPSAKYQFPQNQLIIDHISQIESELTSQRISDSDYFDFKSKYLHLEPVRAANENIKNIQSVQFRHFEKQYQIVNNIPKAFNFQQIRQPQKKQENQAQLIEQNSALFYKKEPKLQFNLNIQETIFKQNLKNQPKQLKPQKNESLSTKITHHAKSSSQKISIVSSNKCKKSQQRSNKTSPSTNQLVQKQAQVMTTIFNLSPPIIETKVENQSANQQIQILKIQQKAVFSTDKDIYNNSRQLAGYPSKKTIKDVKTSIISPIEHPLVPSISLGTVSSPTQEITSPYDSYLIFPHNASNLNNTESTTSQLKLATLPATNKCYPFTANPIKTTMNRFSSSRKQEGSSNLCSYENLNSQISSPHDQSYIRYTQQSTRKYQKIIINRQKQSQDSNTHLLNKKSPLTFQQPLLNLNNPSICIQKQPKQQINCLGSSDFIFDI